MNKADRAGPERAFCKGRKTVQARARDRPQRKTTDVHFKTYGELSLALGKKKKDMKRYIIEQIEGKAKHSTGEDGD